MWRTPSRATLRDLNSRKNDAHSRKRDRPDELGQELTSLTPASLKPSGRSEGAGLLVPFSPTALVPFSASKLPPPSRSEASAVLDSRQARSPGKPSQGLIVAFGSVATEAAAATKTTTAAMEATATVAAAETAAAAGVVVVWATEAEAAAAAAAAAATSEHRVALVLRLAPLHRLSAHRDRVSAAVVRRHGCEHWLALSGVALERREPPGHGLYARLCGAPPASAEVAEQIELDVVRTNVGEGEAGEVEARRAALRRVLLAWAR